MTHQPHFRPCLHRDVISSDPNAAIAAIKGEICLTDPAGASVKEPAPLLPSDIFAITARLLGARAFRQVWADFSRAAPDWMGAGRGFGDFLRQHRFGRDLPALADLAILELASHQAQRAGELPSIGSCCLPAELLSLHPDMRIRLQPGWHYVRLDYPVQEIAADHLSLKALQRLATPEATCLRLMPGEQSTEWERLPVEDYAFESSLARHATFTEALAAACQYRPHYDGIQALRRLIDAGGIIDVLLHPQNTANPITSAGT